MADIEDVAGYCYVAATLDQSIGNPDLVRGCPESEKRMLRFAGKNVPAQGAHVFIGCAGDAFSRENTVEPTVSAPATED